MTATIEEVLDEALAQGGPTLEASAPGDIFELHDNGYVTVAWDAPSDFVRYVLKRPTLEIIDEVLELARVAASQVNDAPEGVEQQRLLTGPRSPWALAFKHALDRMTPHEFAVGDLPAWVADGAAVTRMLNHWRSRPLSRGMGLPLSDDAGDSTENAPRTVLAARSARAVPARA